MTRQRSGGSTPAEDGDSGWSARLRDELGARAAIARLGLTVEPEADGVVIRGPGFTLRAKAARDLVRDLVPAGDRR